MNKNKNKNKNEIRHLSLFSGCGGMDIGLNGNFDVMNKFIPKKSNKLFTRVPKTRIKTVFANDIKNDSRKFWLKNLSHICENFHHESIVDLVKKHKKGQSSFPSNIDIVTGGFPCQDFSISGLRKGFESNKSDKNDRNIKNSKETRGQLYLWMKEVIEIVKPKIFIAENVKGLVDMKPVFEKIKSDFSGIKPGYEVYTRELFAPDYGIPQSRRRVIFIGISKSFIKINKLVITEDSIFPDAKFSKFKDLFIKNIYPKAKFFFEDLDEPELSVDLSQQSYSKAKYANGQGKSEVNMEGFAPTIRSEHHGNIEYRYLSKSRGGINLIDKNLAERRLTVRECARIQTFPDNLDFVYDINKKNGLSASAAYKLIGDAVPPLMAYELFKKIEKLFN